MRHALLTDLYQLTMANAYWRAGLALRDAVFQLYARETPFGGGYALAAGLPEAVRALEGLRPDRDALDYLAGLQGSEGGALLDPDFLRELGALHLELDLEALPEGTAVFAGEPLLRVRGPLWQAQLAETPLLNRINFATLVATKAARVCRAARGKPVLEFGLRRAQGPDGGLTASRAAYLGGCAGTSNVAAGQAFGIPVRGTHAHSWVMAFDAEDAAFDAWCDAMPESAVLLVDTYDALEGVRRAADTGRRLAARGRALAGVRLDSGDLAGQSRAARAILDAAGLTRTQIVASNDLDEHAIDALERAGAPIDAYGVGTRLATAHDQPALGGVYKLGALRGADGRWRRPAKRSADPAKATRGGAHQVRRFTRGAHFARDVVWDALSDEHGPPPGEAGLEGRDLLGPVLRRGERARDLPDTAAAREHAAAQLRALPDGVARLRDPEPYPVAFELKGDPT